MSGFNMPGAIPKFAISSLTVALIVAFPAAHSEPMHWHGYDKGSVKAYGHHTEVKKAKRHRDDYSYLEAGKGSVIVGKNVDVKGRSGTLVFARNGGYIKLEKVDIEAEAPSRGTYSRQGPAVKAAGVRGHGHFATPSQISLKDGSVTTANQHSPALQASDGGVTFVDGTTLNTKGKNSDVVQAIEGGKVILLDADIKSTGSQADGVSVSGRDSMAYIMGSDIHTQGYGSDGVKASGKGTVVIDRARLLTRGEDSAGVSVGKDGTAIVLRSGIETKGRGSDGVRVSGRHATASVSSSRIKTSGRDADGVEVNDGGKAFIERSFVITTGKHADGVDVSDNGKAFIERSFIATLGEDSVAVKVRDGGFVALSDTTLGTIGREAHGLSVSGDNSLAVIADSRIETEGYRADGVDVSSSGTAIINHSRIDTNGNSAQGVSVSRGGKAVINRSRIDTDGAHAEGVNVSGRHSVAIIASSSVKTSGRHSDGISISDDGKAFIARSSVTTRDEDSIGINVSKHGKAQVDQSLITTFDDDSVGVNVDQGGKVLVNQSVISTRDDDSVGINVSEGGKAFVNQSFIAAFDADSAGLNISKGGTAVINESWVATFGDDSTGVNVSRGGKAIVSQSVITTFDDNSTGVNASKGGKAFITESVIATRDRDSDAVRARDGGLVVLDQTAVSTTGRKSDGVDVSGEGSLAWVAGSSIETGGSQAAGVSVHHGAAVALMDSEIVSQGVGLSASSKARALLKESDVQGGVAGIVIRDGARVAVLGGSVSADESGGTALSLEDAGSKVAILGAELTATGAEGVALDVANEGKAYLSNSTLHGQATGLQAHGTGTSVVASESTIRAGIEQAPRLFIAPPTEPVAAVGVLSGNGAEVTLSATKVTANGDKSVAVKTAGGSVSIDAGTISASGAHATALWASQGDMMYAKADMQSAVVAKTGIDAAGTAISTAGDYAVAARATGSGSAVLIDKASALSTTGQKSHGALAEDGGLVSLKHSTVQVSGANTAAARVQSVATDSHSAVSRLVIEGSSLVASGANSSGIELENSARVSLLDSVVRSTGASLVSTLNKAGQTQDIVVGSGARLVENNGTLLQVNRSGEGGSSKVMLDLQDHSVTAGNIIDGLQTPLSGEGGTYVQLGALATFDGYVSGVRQITTKGGNQTLKFEGGSTVDELSIDNNAKTSGGTVDNPIIVYGNASVDNATLGGNWTIKGVLISTNGGILKPGNSVGVINASSINWGPGTIYQAEINEAGQSDLIQVTGSGVADISNTSLVVSPENGVGRFLLNHDYTVLTANGGVQGEFTDTEWTGTTYPLIAMNTLYSENAVAVRMGVNEQALNTMDFTPNQRSAGFGAASVVGKNASADEAFFSSNPAQAFDQLSGEVHATARSLAFSDLLATHIQMQSQMRSNLGVDTQSGGSAATGASDTSFKPGDRPLWIRVNAGSTHVDGDGNAADAHRSATRLMVGGDGAVGRGWRVGAAGAVSSGNFSIDDRRSDGSLSSYTLALYGGNSWDMGPGKLNLLLGGGYTRHDVDTRRNVNVASAQTLRADYHGSTWQMFGDLGYAIPWGTAHNIEPYVNVSWFNQRMDGFDEAGGDAALGSSASSADLASYTLGLRSALVFPGKTQAFTVRSNLGWRHAAGDRAPTRSMSFVEGAGSAFSIAGAPIAKDSLLVGLSAEASLDEHASMGISYNGEFGSGVSDNAGSLFLRVRF